jgi:hypothetical protein
MYFDPGHGEHVIVDGNIVERDVLGIAERIKEYDPDLEIFCLDPDMGDINDAPYVICWFDTRTGSYVRVFECWELNASVYDRVVAADQHRFDALSKVESMESVQAKLKEARYKEKRLEMADLLATAMKHKKTTFKFENTEGDLVTLDETRGVVSRNNDKTYLT